MSASLKLTKKLWDKKLYDEVVTQSKFDKFFIKTKLPPLSFRLRMKIKILDIKCRFRDAYLVLFKGHSLEDEDY